MSRAKITQGMALAAGLGKRMRPITDRIPKPCVEVAGRSLIHRALDHLEAAHVARPVVNHHYLSSVLKDHLSERSIFWSDEDAELLETGGGVKKALPLLGPEPFFVVNSDILLLNGAKPALGNLTEAWDRQDMDALLLLVPTEQAIGYDGPGDFFLQADGRLLRRGEAERAPFVFAGSQILSPRLFDGTPDGAFSLNVCFDKALEDARLFGLVHDGAWRHVGTPDALEAVNAEFGEGV